MRFRISSIIRGLILCLGFVFAMQGQVRGESPIELKISHFGPPDYVQQREVLEPWAKKIEELSAGKVRFGFFSREKLGRAAEQYGLILNGVADIALGLPDYTPGRFPLVSAMKMPFLGEQGERASLVLWRCYEKYLQREFQDVKVLWLFCHGAGQLHTTQKRVMTLEDLKGLRIRIADPFLGRVIERLGAVPVIATASETYKLFQDNKIDGVLIPWEGALNFKFLDFCHNHTVINFYTLPFFVAMNKEKYGQLPVDIRKLIDENSGEQMAYKAGQAFDREDARGMQTARDRGDFIYTVPAAELSRWKKLTMTLGDEWVDEMSAKGLPGQEVLTYIIDLFMQLEMSD